VVFAGLYVGLPLVLGGLGISIEAYVHYQRYLEMRDSGARDPWDSKTEPAEFGPWRPGDP
jgi:hypothetical protein